MTILQRRRWLSWAILLSVIIAFAALYARLLGPTENPLGYGIRVGADTQARETHGCAFRRASAEALGFVDVVASGPVTVTVAHSFVELRQAELDVVGWALTPGPVRVPDGIVAYIDATCIANALIGRERPDVAHALRLPSAETSGFIALIPAQRVPPGIHRLTVLAIDSQRRLQFPIGRPITLLIAH